MSRLSRVEREELGVERVEPHSLGNEAAKLVAREADKLGVECVLECDEGLPTLCGSRNQLHQVLLNLLLNAVHASDEGGRITLRVRLEPAEGDAPAWVRFEVEDSGAGIPEELVDRIFDPFFTTKEPDQGTGLGLMISHRIVSDHGGTIEVESREGEGSCFIVRLPTEIPAA